MRSGHSSALSPPTSSSRWLSLATVSFRWLSDTLPPASPPQRCLSADAPPQRPGQQQTSFGGENTPVWLAIWRIWTGFANSQHRDAAFSCTYLHICDHPHCSYVGLPLRQSKSFGPSAPIAYATSVSPPDEAAAWPDAAFLQITARTNPRSRHLWGTLARAVASI